MKRAVGGVVSSVKVPDHKRREFSARGFLGWTHRWFATARTLDGFQGSAYGATRVGAENAARLKALEEQRTAQTRKWQDWVNSQ